MWTPVRSALLMVSAAIALCSGWLLLAPTFVGGPLSIVVTSGHSMKPAFSTGDLAILHRRPSYGIGDIVGYRSATLHRAVVMHRIIAAAPGGRWVTKGDNNTWLDPDHPSNADIVGKLWVHVRRGGTIMTRYLLPGAFVAFAFLLLPTRRKPTDDEGEDGTPAPPRSRRRAVRPPAAGTRRSAHRSAARPPKRQPTPSRLTDATLSQILAAGCALSALAAAAGLLGFLAPAQRTSTASTPWTHTTTFAWSASVPPSSAYPTGSVVSPQPIFTRIVDTLQVTAHLSTTAKPAARPTLIILDATLSDSSGWERSWQLGTGPVDAAGSATVRGTLSLHRLLAEVAGVHLVSGASGGAMLTLTEHDAAPGSLPVVAALPFTLDPVTMHPQKQLATTTSGSTSAAKPAPTVLDVLGHPVAVRTLRRTAPIMLLIGLGISGWAAWSRRRRETETTEERLERLFGNRAIRLTAASPPGPRCHQVSDPAALEAFATVESAVLLVQQAPAGTVFTVERGDHSYRYDPAAGRGLPASPRAAYPPFAAVPGIPGPRENPDVPSTVG